MAETVLSTSYVGSVEPLITLPAATEVKYSYRLNRPGSISFSVPADWAPTQDWYDPALGLAAVCEVGVHWVTVRRNRGVVWRGPISTLREDSTVATFGGEGVQAHMRKWHVTADLTFAAVDQFEIARVLVNRHQLKAGGYVGINTNSTTLSGTVRDRTYLGSELPNTYDAILDLAEVRGGFDLDVNPATLTFDLFFPRRGTRRDDIVLGDHNIRSWSRDEDATKQASEVFGIGHGEGAATLIATAQDSSAVAVYGLTQRVFSRKNVLALVNLQAAVDRQLASFSLPPRVVGVTVGPDDPPLGSYQVGDEIRVTIPSLYRPIAGWRRIYGIDVVWNGSSEDVVLAVGEIGPDLQNPVFPASDQEAMERAELLRRVDTLERVDQT